MLGTRLSIVVCACVALLAAAGSASARPAQTIAVHSSFTDPGFLTGQFKGIDCPLQASDPCEGEFHGHSEVPTGTMRGHSEYDIWGYVDPTTQALSYHAYETFTGTIDGCGTGSFAFTLAGHAESAIDSSGQFAEQIHGTWKAVRHSGTGGLAGLRSGSGTETGTAGPGKGNGSLDPSANDGNFDGSVSCRPAN